MAIAADSCRGRRCLRTTLLRTLAGERGCTLEPNASIHDLSLLQIATSTTSHLSFGLAFVDLTATDLEASSTGALTLARVSCSFRL